MSKKSVRWSTVTVYEFGVGIGGSASELATKDSTQEVQGGKAGDAHAVAPTAARRHRRRVRWLKPLERVTMLEKAGYSEERIYRMLMESSSIAQSRRLCLRAVSLECAAA
ncbi:hypothetical protein PF005_g21190 [Phytophthora fragariae]|uniref:Uncharacterized protein n=1 Tax=Phytophthora fragariae TaxID=53985 RepID=A0A6A4CGP4_9STRA|nr:hypothetical protein PF003_g6905 [Phytophthora fragariae]KAE8927572.1 hypothetical protein PF009_g22263 [Phytophthora fragariae]KAE8997106.1 hypothetical protein PF011_g15625 [Phytophthora fragariae]KAE9064194.1 hypothetical protein PF006_g30757 [Phytophthora fragariae]KAE9085209.1 hypothetical protein PF010_g20549 [Phytophthora fragariae]